MGNAMKGTHNHPVASKISPADDQVVKLGDFSKLQFRFLGLHPLELVQHETKLPAGAPSSINTARYRWKQYPPVSADSLSLRLGDAPARLADNFTGSSSSTFYYRTSQGKRPRSFQRSIDVPSKMTQGENILFSASAKGQMEDKMTHCSRELFSQGLFSPNSHMPSYQLPLSNHHNDSSIRRPLEGNYFPMKQNKNYMACSRISRFDMITSECSCNGQPNHVYQTASKARSSLSKTLSINFPFEKTDGDTGGPILSYQIGRLAPLQIIRDRKRTQRQRLTALYSRLMHLRMRDKITAENGPANLLNGIHVFLDMSNINISFQWALRRKYSICKQARFMPSPVLDVWLLTKLLVRGRRVVALNVGCSVLPGCPEPSYVQNLRNLGYHVDLRERKRVAFDKSAFEEKSSSAIYSSSDDLMAAGATFRYEEHLVDETLQTRIAESVMEFFHSQGTLVLATGDAQPAKFSDGFLAYAERAMRMGWNVEVVAWRTSLSSHWQRALRKAKWGDRFRIIELDEFLDELLA